MVPESVVASTARVPIAITSGALAADLFADSADLLDVAAVLGVEFRRVVAELRRAPASPAPRVLDALTRLGTPPTGVGRPRAGGPHGEAAPPFVWVQLVPLPSRAPRPRRAATVHAAPTVRAGWLDAAALRLLVAEARTLGLETEIHVIVPLDSRDGTAARVRALCAGVAPEVKLTIDVQGESRTSRDSRRGRHGFRTGTWIVFDPALAS